ncbi:hypothetical protein [Hathewaya limosa]|uniref:ABC-type transport system involved in multi-copper enzyme maturation permease subunit n=1 Tax=Hathewaya limosa TaxID=1536 RepID=A0ABU0JUH7_HATLI|nr:hypothetical protein [Hathewaya limosa]MDQ0480055.1 ABC-type transport system involved in multi-copper enzyme maturation permease subunit [Hathewaya limosa]
MNSIRSIFNCIKIEFKNIFRIKAIKFIIPIICIYCWYVYVTSIFFEYEIWDVLRASSFVPMVLMLLFMVLGFYLAKEEQQYNLDEVFFSIYRGKIIKLIGKLLTLLSLILSVIFFCMISIFICSAIKGAPSIFYKQSIMYFIIYYLLSLFIEAIIGMIIGYIVKSKISYLLMLIIWFTSIPLNGYIFKSIVDIVSLDLRAVQYFLNLGQYDINSGINIMTGMPIQGFNLVQRVLIFMVGLSILLIINLINSKKSSIAIVLITIGIVVPTFNIYKRNLPTVKSLIYFGDGEKKDVIYYSLNKQFSENTVKFDIKKCNIILREDKTEEFETKMYIMPRENLKSLQFSLYNGFNIKKVLDDTNKALTFKRDGDFITVLLDKSLKKGESKEITFIYDNESSPLFSVNKDMIILPNYFNYYPSNIIAPSMTDFNNSGLFTNDLSYKADFTVNIEGNKKVYSNLESVGSNQFKGTNCKGVTLYRGMITEDKYKNITYCYPSIQENSRENAKKFIDKYDNSVDKLNKKFDLDIEGLSNIKKILFMPIYDEGSSLGDDIFRDNDILIVKVDNDTTTIPFNEEDIENNILGNYLRQAIKNEDQQYIKDLIIMSLRDQENIKINNDVGFLQGKIEGESQSSNRDGVKYNLEKALVTTIRKKDDDKFNEVLKVLIKASKEKNIDIKKVSMEVNTLLKK